MLRSQVTAITVWRDRRLLSRCSLSEPQVLFEEVEPHGIEKSENLSHCYRRVRFRAGQALEVVLARRLHLGRDDRMQRNFEPMQRQVEAWQQFELTDVTAKVVIYEAFAEGQLEVPKHSARTVHDLYFEPKYDEFRSRTIRSLSNAFSTRRRRRAKTCRRLDAVEAARRRPIQLFVVSSQRRLEIQPRVCAQVECNRSAIFLEET